MQKSLPLIAIVAMSVLTSCRNSSSNKTLDQQIWPPNRLEFTTASTARPANNKSGFVITGTIKGTHILMQDTNKQEIELILQFPNGKSDNKFYWSSKQSKQYPTQDMKQSVLYIGRDDANIYAEVEYFYDDQDSLSMVILRSPQNNTIIILNNLLNLNLPKT